MIQGVKSSVESISFALFLFWPNDHRTEQFRGCYPTNSINFQGKARQLVDDWFREARSRVAGLPCKLACFKTMLNAALTDLKQRDLLAYYDADLEVVAFHEECKKYIKVQCK